MVGTSGRSAQHASAVIARARSVDQILSVGDAAVQRGSMRHFHDVRGQGCTILIVTHDECLVRSICQRCPYLTQGRMVAFGAAAEVDTLYMTDLLPPEPVEGPAIEAPPVPEPPPRPIEPATPQTSAAI